MSARISLLKQPADGSVIDKLAQLITDVVARLDQRENCDALIEEINELSGGKPTPAKRSLNFTGR